MSLTPTRSRRSALNRLRYACEHDFLPCKTYDCVFADECRADPATQADGFPEFGADCALERREHDQFIASALESFSFATQWLDEAEYRSTIERMSRLRIRWARITARMNAEGAIVRRNFPDGRTILREHIASRRYWASTQREWSKLLDRLLVPPDRTSGP